MLLGFRTLLAAVFGTALVATLIAAALMPAPGESFTHAAVFAWFEQPLARQVRAANPKQQSRMPGYAPAIEALGSPVKMTAMDGGVSTFAKTQISLQPVDLSVTGSVNGASPDAVQNQDAHKCGSCPRDDRQWRNRNTGFRPARSRPHGHVSRPWTSRHGIRMSPDRNSSL
jgi:hypothetical protein